jgi:uncharacterized protein YgbK (DUF1537 family)
VVTRRLVCLSDDLTGAVACAAEIERAGLRTVVAPWDEPWPDADAVVLDTDSRGLDEPAASGRVAAALASLPPGAGSPLYKRIDSGLRGNVRAELAAASAALSGVPGVVAAAAPALGTVTRAGVQLHRGAQLTASPYGGGAEASRATGPAALVPGGAAAIALGRVRSRDLGGSLASALGAGRWPVCDAETDDDLRRIAAAALTAGAGLLVGSYGLAGALARAIVDAPARRPEGVLVLTATARGSTRAQLRALLEGGAREVPPERPEAAAAALREGHVVLVGPARDAAPGAVHDVAEAAAAILASARPAGVVVVGGGLASALHRACGSGQARVLCEPWPATPVVEFESGPLAGVPAILKSGALGEPTWLVHAVDALRGVSGARPALAGACAEAT